MHYQTKSFQVSPHCHCYCDVIIVVVVIYGGYDDGGVIA